MKTSSHKKRISHPCLPKWRKRIDAAEMRGHFTNNDVKRAGTWNQCAISEARKQGLMGDDDFGMPYDETLRDFGFLFASKVSCNDFDGARKNLIGIENRLGNLAQKVRS